MENEYSQYIPAYKKRDVPRMLNIKGLDIYYKDPPLNNDIFIYRFRKSNSKYYIKINRININKISNKEKEAVFT